MRNETVVTPPISTGYGIRGMVFTALMAGVSAVNARWFAGENQSGKSLFTAGILGGAILGGALLPLVKSNAQMPGWDFFEVSKIKLGKEPGRSIAYNSANTLIEMGMLIASMVLGLTLLKHQYSLKEPLVDLVWSEAAFLAILFTAGSAANVLMRFEHHFDITLKDAVRNCLPCQSQDETMRSQRVPLLNNGNTADNANNLNADITTDRNSLLDNV